MLDSVIQLVIFLGIIDVGFGVPLAVLTYSLIKDAEETKEVNEWERTLRQNEEN